MQNICKAAIIYYFELFTISLKINYHLIPCYENFTIRLRYLLSYDCFILYGNEFQLLQEGGDHRHRVC